MEGEGKIEGGRGEQGKGGADGIEMSSILCYMRAAQCCYKVTGM